MKTEPQLQLQHLSPYLPYGLKVLRSDDKIDRLIGITFSDDTDYKTTKETFHDINHPLANLETHTSEFYDIRPILKPMAELASIFNNFIDVMPFGEEYKSCLFLEEKQLTKLTDLFIIKSTVCSELVINKKQPLVCPYLAVHVMIENHFDVFGLIEQGLAIDINQLNKTEK